jgi:CheY-like chemotaxis protein
MIAPERPLLAPGESSPITVLVVEDEPMLLEVVVDELRDAGFNVLSAGTGEEACEYIWGDRCPDVLFTDIRLPGSIDGWDIAEQFRSACPDQPVIYATGFATLPVRRVPKSRLFEKPYRPSKIIGAIGEMMGPAS